MPASGGPATRITPVISYEGHPAWSPDGTQIAYEARSHGVMEIFVIPARGGEALPGDHRRRLLAAVGAGRRLHRLLRFQRS